MPYPLPTLQELIERNQSDINLRLPGADARLRRSVLNALSYQSAAGEMGLYGYLSWIIKQAFPDTADEEYLARWAGIYGKYYKAAQKAGGNIIATGTNGALIEAGNLLTRSDGIQFITQLDAVIASGQATIPVLAVTPGSDSNTAANSTLNFVSTPSDINNTVTVDEAGLISGTDLELPESLLNRLLLRIRKPPQGGNADDYEAWALEVPGVTRAWVYRRELGLGTVTVRFLWQIDGLHPDGIPLPADVTAVQMYIDSKRPVTAEVFVVAPIPDPITFNIHLNVADTSAIRAAVEAELRDMLTRDAIPGGTIYLSRIHEAISTAEGEYDHTLNSPSANVTETTGHIATFGSITWS